MSRIDQALSNEATRRVPDGATNAAWTIRGMSMHCPTRPTTLRQRPPRRRRCRVASSRPRQSQSPRRRRPLADIAPVARCLSEKVVGGHAAAAGRSRSIAALARSLHHMQVERGIRVVMVTSAVAGEGKTLTATNLALTLSASYGRNVLLDRRRPATSVAASRVQHGVSCRARRRSAQRRTAECRRSCSCTPRLTLLTAGRPDADPLAA